MKRPTRTVSDQLAHLQTLDRPELLYKWEKAYGQPPLKGARQHTLVRGIMHQVQCKALGSLKPNIGKSLLKIANNGNVEAMMPVRKSTIQAGNQLVREWNGKTHTVIVTDGGYVLNGITYTSLSATAKAITGAHWSGPRFFGVAS